MREIKFRVWDIYFKKMYNVKRLEFLSGGINVVLDDEEESYSDGCEIMQYTGLKDKNGKEIYEGDLVNDLGNVGEMFWDEDGVRFWSSNEGHINKNGFCEELLLHNPEIIGNIYENPEMSNRVDKEE